MAVEDRLVVMRGEIVVIREEVAEIRKVLQDVRDSQLRAEGECKACVTKVGGHDLVLYGNSHRGLKSKVDLMWSIFGWGAMVLGAGGGVVAIVMGIVYLSRLGT